MNLFKILLAIHITGGGISLLSGAVLSILKKGSKGHVLLGKIYFYALLSAAFVALPMCYLHPNYFLFIIGVFTSYMLLSGKRYLLKKKITDVSRPDWMLIIAMLLFGLAFIALAVFNIVKGNSFGTVLLVFGFISLLFVYQDYRNFTGKSSINNYWLTTHIQRMLGSYFASVTAFIVVNNTLLPGILAWPLPIVIVTPLIVFWTIKYKIEKLPSGL